MNSGVVVDTGVFGASLSRRGSHLASLYARHLTGQVLVLAAQSVAELRYGALLAGWGHGRVDELERRIAAARVVPPDNELVWAHARLRVACRNAGHPLAADAHAANLWVAVTAVHFGMPLVAHDGVFRGTPGLALVTNSTNGAGSGGKRRWVGPPILLLA